MPEFVPLLLSMPDALLDSVRIRVGARRKGGQTGLCLPLFDLMEKTSAGFTKLLREPLFPSGPAFLFGGFNPPLNELRGALSGSWFGGEDALEVGRFTAVSVTMG